MAGGAFEGAFRGVAKLDLRGLKLIETLRYDGGFVRLDRHLARLEASAQRLGWFYDAGRVAEALAGVTGPARVRLTLDAGGGVRVELAPLPVSVDVWRVGLAVEMLRSGDPWLTVKSTQRADYDAARARLSGLDEVIFQNERGEVCDGTISTVFFDRGHGLRTPPLTCGLLPGVLRAEMLAAGCLEEVLMVQDLGRVRLWIGNSLRGMMRGEWVEGV